MKPNSANLFADFDRAIQLHANALDLHNFNLDLSPCCAVQAERFRARNPERHFRLLSFALKENRNPPQIATLFSLFWKFFRSSVGSLHTRVGASHYSWSAPGVLPSDWWRATCIIWYSYSTDELLVSCVHIAVYTA